jgi:hypothetical protein
MPPPTTELLVQCLRAEDGDPTATEAVRALARRAADWDGVVRSAVAHSVTPALYGGLRSAGALEELPRPVAGQLRARHEAGVRRALLMTGELLRLVDALSSASVRVVPFKGPVLAALLYGDVGMREYVDLDLFVRPADIEPSIREMRRLGYHPALQFSSEELKRFMSYGNEVAFSGGGDQLVDLEWAIAPRYFGIRFPLSSVFSRLQDVKVGGATLPTPSVEDLLLLLCVHGGKHLWERLSWVRDIARLLVRFPDLEASTVLRRADAAHVRRMVVTGLWMADLVVGVRPPEGFQDAMSTDTDARALATTLRSQIMQRLPSALDPPFRPLHLRLRERRRDRVLHAVRLATTPTLEDWRAIRLPGPLSFGYYVVRPYRLLTKYRRW